MLDFVIIAKAIFLGIIEGLTEFIPVSSTAHLLLTSWFIDFSYIQNGVFEIAIQFGAVLAVCFLYREKILNLTTTFTKEPSKSFILNIILAFLPAAFIGALLHKFIKELLFCPEVIASALIIGGIIIIMVEKSSLKAKTHNIDKITKYTSLLIGLFQTIAIIPGISRSGATIIGGMLLKLDRKIATEFSFFLAIPTIFGATVYDLYKNREFLNWSNIEIIAIGFVVSFLSSLVVIKWLIKFVSNNNFIPFAYYRIILGLIVWGIILF